MPHYKYKPKQEQRPRCTHIPDAVYSMQNTGKVNWAGCYISFFFHSLILWSFRFLLFLLYLHLHDGVSLYTSANHSQYSLHSFYLSSVFHCLQNGGIVLLNDIVQSLFHSTHCGQRVNGLWWKTAAEWLLKMVYRFISRTKDLFQFCSSWRQIKCFGFFCYVASLT